MTGEVDSDDGTGRPGVLGPAIGPGILEGVRVLDLTRVVAGPSCTRVLADLGAEVIKIEPPEGDLLRTGWPRRGGLSVLFAGQNVGKRFLSVDLTRPEGVELVLDLAERCDVVVENFRPGVAARLGVGYEQVRPRRPGRRLLLDLRLRPGRPGRQPPGLRPRRARRGRPARPQGQGDRTARPPPSRSPTPTSRSAWPAPRRCSPRCSGASGAAGGAWIDASMCEAMLATNEWTEVEVNGGPDYERSPVPPRSGRGRAARRRRTAPGSPSRAAPRPCCPTASG